ncbi:hypothetical protein E4K67_00735 [Desulfosporosinus fructosivorans]|uniref:Uncharacterized protein n=1 Tax=Desulfosporosinus fructosivorans TaxID=2018669 RepID=A0A4Z0RC64_9FIRM|nr:hypothetical protein [Desulfosporosinus fructosivorans]TGE39573.1 hypothetical protein E4K67_00735 [Desulfosporosinus fructosivorans]
MSKREQQAALVAECRASGITAKGIQYSRYVTWATKLNREGQHKPQQWANVTMVNEERSMSEVRLKCGKWIICVETGFSPSLLADVLKIVDTVY